MTRVALVAICCALSTSACTFEDGEGFATLEGASLAFELTTPVLHDGRGYALTLSSAEIGVGELSLFAHATALEPEGSHSHATPEEPEPEADAAAVARLPVEAALDWLSGTPLELSRVEPSRELPRGRIEEIELAIVGIELTGSLTADPPIGPIAGAPTPVSVSLSASESLRAPLAIEIDRDGPESLSLDVIVTTGDELVERVDWQALSSSGQIVIDDPDSPAAHALLESMLTSAVNVTIRRP